MRDRVKDALFIAGLMLISCHRVFDLAYCIHDVFGRRNSDYCVDILGYGIGWLRRICVFVAC